MSLQFNRLKKILLSIRLFSLLVIQKPLRKYQVEPCNAVIDSCLYRQGLEFLFVFPRQSGKDESIAQLVVYLLTLFRRVEAGIVHTYPTAQQIPIGVTRLENRLDNLWTEGRWWSKGKPIRRGLGLAQCAFFSGHPSSRAEGATANLLLIVNEVQDHNEAIVERRFTPMRASTNATAVFVGTVRTTNDYLWRVKQRLEKLQAQDGIRRVFFVGPDEVGAENSHYAEFVRNQVRLKGRQHPAVKTELFLEPVDVGAGLFPERRRNLMRGRHPRLKVPQEGEQYIALIDVGGQDEAATAGAFVELNNPKRDYTSCTMVRVLRDERWGFERLHYEAVDVWAEQGRRHFQDAPGKPSLFSKLMGYLRTWEPVLVVCDSTGVGQGIYDALAAGYKRGPVFGFDFGGGRKARLGNDFLAIVETSRFKYFRDRLDSEGTDEWFFFLQCEHCACELAEGMPIERGLKWGVPDSAKAQLSSGDVILVHDDRLLSAGLLGEVDRLYREGEIFLSTGESAVIRQDLLKEIDEQGEW